MQSTTQGIYELHGDYLLSKAQTGGHWNVARTHVGSSGVAILIPVGRYPDRAEAVEAARQDGVGNPAVVRTARAEMALDLLDRPIGDPEWRTGVAPAWLEEEIGCSSCEWRGPRREIYPHLAQCTEFIESATRGQQILERIQEQTEQAAP